MKLHATVRPVQQHRGGGCRLLGAAERGEGGHGVPDVQGGRPRGRTHAEARPALWQPVARLLRSDPGVHIRQPDPVRSCAVLCPVCRVHYTVHCALFAGVLQGSSLGRVYVL